MEDIATWLGQQLDEDERFARSASGTLGTVRPWYEAQGLRKAMPGMQRADCLFIARHDPARVLREVAAKRRIVELHTTGSWRTYQCGNADHIQEWQCERAKEPYVEHRYCEVCSHDCVELPALAEIYADRPGFKPEWAAQ